ncbi:FHA domain-containing protein [uncultured Bacteroides sp.]|uniref:FHA domain-containing protein n=1 Tax=uncultured Bacteroides sp. TaxID=162156 RepID=UPI002AAAF423|nr:FHA domain-containing protein [uncultured Bacteroides sp.]
MKRILCPKCENYLSFDETKYTEGQSLVFVCEHCGKQFSIRLGKTKMKATRKEETFEEETQKDQYGYVTVVENIFGFKQILPLKEGDNEIGRRCVGTIITTPIETGDMSMDRRHCIINVKRNKAGKIIYTLRDAPSLTGTFLRNEILGDKDRIRIEDGAVITIGATTLILHEKENTSSPTK